MAIRLPLMSPTALPSPTAQLIEIKLGGDLAGYLKRARAAGKSWRIISADIYIATGIDVSYELVRTWHLRLVDAA